jgi:hypothetical protein
VVRGGSWINHPDNARAAYRNRRHRRNANQNQGFRFALSSRGVRPARGGAPGRRNVETSACVLPHPGAGPRAQTARPPGCW